MIMEKEIVTLTALTLGTQLIAQIPADLSESDHEDSDEDEITILVIRKKRKLHTPQRIAKYLENVVANFTAQQFQQHFRITVETYEKLLTLMGPQLMRQRIIGRPVVNVEKQILAVIWLLATPDSYRSVGERFDLAKSTLSICFVRIIKMLNALAPTIIKWPTNERLNDVKIKFRRAAGLNNVIGCIDGTYVPIKAPKEDAVSYITRKCNYAFTLQAIADPWLKFTDIFIAYPGSVSDTRIFRNSDIYNLIRNNIQLYCPGGEYIIGDKAYPVMHWCIPPYINRGNLTLAQVYFNTVHAKTRQVIERAFALLFGRFRRLKYLDMNRTDLVPGTVLAACVLHNICLNSDDLRIENYIQEGIDHVRINNADEVDIPPFRAEERHPRDAICRELYQLRNNQHN